MNDTKKELKKYMCTTLLFLISLIHTKCHKYGKERVLVRFSEIWWCSTILVMKTHGNSTIIYTGNTASKDNSH